MIAVKTAATGSFVVGYRSVQQGALYFPCDTTIAAVITAVIPGPTGCTGSEIIVKNNAGAQTTVASCTSGLLDDKGGCVLAATKYIHVVSSGAKWLIVDHNGVLF